MDFIGCEAKYRKQILAYVSLYYGIYFHPLNNYQLEDFKDKELHIN